MNAVQAVQENRREARKIKEKRGFTIFSQKISTRGLTVLIISVILQLEQRKRENKKRKVLPEVRIQHRNQNSGASINCRSGKEI